MFCNCHCFEGAIIVQNNVGIVPSTSIFHLCNTCVGICTSAPSVNEPIVGDNHESDESEHGERKLSDYYYSI